MVNRLVLGTMARNLANVARYYPQSLLRPTRLLVHLDWNLGDEIMAIPLFRCLRRRFPRAILGVQSKHPDLFLHNPFVDEINPANVGRWGCVLDIRGEERGKPRLRYWESLLGLRVEDRQPRLYFSPQERQAILAARNSTGKRPRVAVSVGAVWRSKRWSESHFRSMVQELCQHRPDVYLLELGKDCPWLGLGENYIGRTGIREAAILLAGCDVFVGNDSGLMHLAAAAGITAVGLFGPVDPASLVVDCLGIYPVRAGVECRGCWTAGRMQNPDQCPLGEPICMDSIQPSVVCQRVLGLLRTKGHP